ncbi:glycosyltransferase [Thaumasiovibrio subtropicus]|uniref:glycosyltransferase n=2 Tax=Thaumasiovibrio subtropicus TaxID=1891207 RepID=UPI0031BA1505
MGALHNSPPKYEREDAVPRPLIYMSMGTIESQDKTLFNRLLSLISDISEYDFIVSLGGQDIEVNSENLPNNISVYASVDQKSILRKASAFISHGGQNSVNESLFFGVPLLILPRTDERRLIAETIESFGAAFVLDDKRMNGIQFREALLRLVNEPDLANKASSLGDSLRLAGGVNRACTEIETYLVNHKTICHQQEGTV